MVSSCNVTGEKCERMIERERELKKVKEQR